jgi:hypothetical protein
VPRIGWATAILRNVTSPFDSNFGLYLVDLFLGRKAAGVVQRLHHRWVVAGQLGDLRIPVAQTIRGGAGDRGRRDGVGRAVGGAGLGCGSAADAIAATITAATMAVTPLI